MSRTPPKLGDIGHRRSSALGTAANPPSDGMARDGSDLRSPRFSPLAGAAIGAGTVMYALRTHPAVIIGGLQEPPFSVDHEPLLREHSEQRSHVRAGMTD
jgi:hypothetical protein